ncbi:MAG TPA: ABC transporter permease [Tepidisphaeraceae bacterium]|jgi:NitT/TauT family transport system permease protein|nr:ABC transporter permease [Tepidisphaeraceae bacterium]
MSYAGDTTDLSPKLMPAASSRNVPGIETTPSRRRSRLLAVRAPIGTGHTLFLGVMGFVLFIGFWHWQSASAANVILASPWDVLKALYTLLAERNFAADIGTSVVRILASFTAACAVAVPLGIVMGTFTRAGALLNPVVAVWRYLPAPAFVPLLLMWFGTGEMQKLALLFLGVVFFLITLVMDHTKQVSMDLIEVAQTLGASRRRLMFSVVVPAVMPHVLDVMRQMLAVSWTYLVIAEIVASTDGIGAVMMRAKRFMRTEDVLAGILVIGALGLAFDCLFRLARHVVFPYLRLKAAK